MKRAFKVGLVIFLLVLVLGFVGLGFYVGGLFLHYSNLKLDSDLLTSQSLAIEVFDANNRPIKEENMFNSNCIKVAELPAHVKDAFVSIEDKNFYHHHGVNYKRIAKAMWNNIKSMDLKEGASTISQQLIKNTHLSSEKTFTRKIKEVALTKKLEKQFSKDQILEQYLNVIYFGHNCYGIEKAANYYFSKSAHDLDLDEAAVLAGLIKSPGKYSPITHPQNCLERRNIVLKEMEKDGKISVQQYMSAKSKDISLNVCPRVENRLNCYSEAAIEEAKSLLGLPAKEIALRGYQIHTYQNLEKQTALEKAIEDVGEIDDDYAAIVVDNKKHAIVGYVGKSNFCIITARRQPGSCIKPILVYGPALNEDIISPATQLLDEKTTIGGYSPKNVSDRYSGYVSARQALAKSINIPAVKVLSYVGIEKAKGYAENMGLTFEEDDDSYALALGGMCYGVTIKQLASAYSTLANGGMEGQNNFISYITDKNDKLVYVHRPQEKRVLREDAAYLLTDMLKTSATSGTAKKLSALELDIAAKTGTVGKNGSKDNLDAWNVSYTDAQTCAVWIGNLDNKPTQNVGGGKPTQIAKNYFEKIGDNSQFALPSSIVSMPIDLTELQENHRVVLANSFTPERYTVTEKFSRFNLPSDVSKRFTQIDEPNLQGEIVGQNATLTFDAKDYFTYSLFADCIDEKNLIEKVAGKSGKISLSVPMNKERQRFLLVVSFAGQFNNPQQIVRQVDLIKTALKTSAAKWYI